MWIPKIVNNKEILKNTLNDLQDDVLIMLYRNMINDVSLKQTAKEITKIENVYLTPLAKEGMHFKAYSKAFLKQALLLYKQGKSYAWSAKQGNVMDFASSAFIFLERHYKILTKTNNECVSLYEKTMKDREIDKLLEIPKNLVKEDTQYKYYIDKKYKHISEKEINKLNIKKNKIHSYKCFVLCSKHLDSAKDHEKRQGKLYVKKWGLRYKEVREYCEKHNINYTLEWVIKAPVRLITRPNCRHYFKELSLDEIEDKSEDELLKEYNMISSVGIRENIQTINHNTHYEWYTLTNIQNIIKEYEDRKARHIAMAKVENNDKIKNAIAKDNLLLRKWKLYFNSLK